MSNHRVNLTYIVRVYSRYHPPLLGESRIIDSTRSYEEDSVPKENSLSAPPFPPLQYLLGRTNVYSTGHLPLENDIYYLIFLHNKTKKLRKRPLSQLSLPPTAYYSTRLLHTVLRISLSFLGRVQSPLSCLVPSPLRKNAMTRFLYNSFLRKGKQVPRYFSCRESAESPQSVRSYEQFNPINLLIFFGSRGEKTAACEYFQSEVIILSPSFHTWGNPD